MEYKVTEKDLIGDIKDFPVEVVQRMIDCQLEQDNKACIDILQGEKTGGFEWRKTKEGLDFWHKVIEHKNFDLFFQKYPKQKQLTIQKDMETNKLILNGITLPKGTEAKVSVEEGATIITFQKQESDGQKFKKGDIIFVTDTNDYDWITIFNKIENGIIYSYADFDIVGNRFYGNNSEKNRLGDMSKTKNIRLATKEEEEKLFKELANQKQLRWNAEEFKFEELRWRAVNEQKYYYVNEYGVQCSDGDYGFELDNKRYALRNYFQTRELANKAWPLYRDFFKNLKLD